MVLRLVVVGPGVGDSEVLTGVGLSELVVEGTGVVTTLTGERNHNTTCENHRQVMTILESIITATKTKVSL